MQDKLKELEIKYCIDWREFEISELFEVRKGKRLPERVLHDTKGNIALVSQSTQNNMIARYSGMQGDNEIYQGSAITFGVNTKALGFQQSQFYTIADVLFLKADFLNVQNSSFMKSVIEKSLPHSGWDKIFGLEKMKKLVISLPVRKGAIAFDYIEEFVSTLEVEHLATLEAERLVTLEVYLLATNLKNTELNEEERSALYELEEINFKKFSISEIFNISSPKKKFNANTISFGGKFPYIARGDKNNGIRGYINEDVQFLNNENTISFGQDTATMFYQSNPFFTGDKIKIFTAIDSAHFNKSIALFMISSMRKSFAAFSWGSSSYNVDILNKTEVSLPVKDDGTIAYDFITNIMQATQKLVIKEVIDYLDKRIETTRRIIDNVTGE